ncbi:MAG TPA: MBL fold metallo-hydrolase [Aquabacterium sp.]|nr:MBL fold metallo-hydrolase [Aquabacterium sp.]HQC96652.1 MBL fold metallo-hydrolase [Aquabacterium sp.]
MNVWQIGQVRITQVVEAGPSPTSTKFLFKDPPADLVQQHGWLLPHFASADGKLLMSVHAFVIESAGRTIVVDTCVGNDKPRQNPGWNRLQTNFLADLSAAGFAPERIDTVLCTHLHVDHVGWNTRWDGSRWVPTFPRARYLFARTEWAHWAAEAEARRAASPDAGPEDDVFGDSVQPILDAGLADLVAMDHRLTDEVWLEPTPGHTPGHVSVRISSGAQQAVITGDLMHHPIQCSEPDRLVKFDSDAQMARDTRRRFLACCAADRSLVLGTHFAHPTAGRVVAAGPVWRFEVQADATAGGAAPA